MPVNCPGRVSILTLYKVNQVHWVTVEPCYFKVSGEKKSICNWIQEEIWCLKVQTVGSKVRNTCNGKSIEHSAKNIFLDISGEENNWMTLLLIECAASFVLKRTTRQLIFNCKIFVYLLNGLTYHFFLNRKPLWAWGANNLPPDSRINKKLKIN